MLQGFSQAQILEAVQSLDERSRAEYGTKYGLIELLSDADRELAAARLQRLTGVLLKWKFATEVEVVQSLTKAKHGWEWASERFDEPDLQLSGEYQILVELRQYLHETAQRPNTWEDLQRQADHERGLFKVLALWTADMLKQRERKSYKEYLAAQQDAGFCAILDVADFVAVSALIAALVPFIPVPDVVIALVLIGTAYGYRKITDVPYEGDKSFDSQAPTSAL